MVLDATGDRLMMFGASLNKTHDKKGYIVLLRGINMAKTYNKEDLPATDLNEWGYPNDDYMHIGNGLFKKRGD